MSDHRILLIENPASLAVDLTRLRIRRHGFNDYFVSPRDIAVLCLHHHTIQITVQAIRALAEAGASVIITDKIHHPCAWLLPQVGSGELGRRLRQQIAFDSSEEKARLWQAIVQTKLNTQAVNLRHLERPGALRLERLAKQVQPGDVTKCEGQGAKHYWANLFEEGFKREKQGADDNINARLNFGYAVLRAMIARALVMAGLNPALGLGHYNLENPFNLADDFIEPYRFIVDRHIAQGGRGEFDSAARKNILGFVKQEIKLKGGSYRLPAAITESVASFVRVLEGKKAELNLPQDALGESKDDESWA